MPVQTKAFAVSIGNTDNKLSQQDWSKFVDEVRFIVSSHATQIHFFGGSPTWQPWQNVAWIFETDPDAVNAMISKLIETRRAYLQDSVMVMYSEVYLL